MKVFLSHTSEMAEYPQGRTFLDAAKDAVIEANFTLDEMQFFPASDSSPRELVAERLDPCDIYVGILGFKYGSTVRDQPDVSYTQFEFRMAKETGKTLLVFLLDEKAEGLTPAAILDTTHGARQTDFRREVQDLDGKGIVCQRFKNPDELQRLLVRSLRQVKEPTKTEPRGPTAAAREVFDTILTRYAQRQFDRWQACLRGEHDRRDRLDHYVEPHYSVLKPEAQLMQTADRFGKKNPEDVENHDRYEPVANEGDSAEDELAKLLTVSRKLCLAEDAGAGKSVFTRRVLAFASSPRGREALFDGKPCLAVRWEQWEDDWPSDFQRALADAIAEDCADEESACAPEDLVTWALREGRVLLILDGLDQVAEDDVIQGVARFLGRRGRNCRVVLTGRSYKVEQHRRTLFRGDDWRFARIEGFDDDQIAQYLGGYDIDEVFPDRQQLADLLRIPSVLRIARELLEESALKRFSTRGELYLQASHQLIHRAAQLVDPQFEERQTRRIEQILAAVAFEMMTRELYGYSARGVDIVDKVERGAAQRCEKGISDHEWTLIREVTNFTNHCILEGSSQAMLSWQHRGMMEFYCGLHMARYAKHDCTQVAGRFTNSGDWYWGWRFAIEMPETVSDAEIRVRTLSSLLRPPADGRRPNELIYRAWRLLESTSDGQAALAQFQREFQELLSDVDPLALQIEQGLLLCPPDADCNRLTFLMGSPDSDGDAPSWEKPQIEMTVRPFQMASAPTTNEQYGLYDPAHRSDPNFEQGLRRHSPDNDCPVIYVTWYDAWCFARWCGCRLPTEVEWEYACRAGTTTRYWWGNELDESKCTFNTNQTTPASTSHANPWKLMEMSGNVYEWCDTWFHEQIEVAAQSGFQGTSRVLRGGSFLFLNPLYLRSADRGRSTPDFRLSYFGFRLSRTP